MKKWIVISLVLSAFVLNMKAQMEPWYYISDQNLDFREGKVMFFNFESSHFFINNEFFGPIVEGYTLPGHIVQPSFVAYASKNLTLEAGANIKKFYGRNEEFKVRPVMSARLKFSPHLQLVMGSLDGHQHHKMLDAVYSNERNVFNPIENGIQFKYDKNSTWADLWLNWEQFIRSGDTIPEIFTVGLSVRQDLLNDQEGWRVTMPVQGTVMHEGGQISDFDTPSQSLVNYSAGIEVSRFVDGLISNAGFFGHWVGFKDLREVNVHEIYTGGGFYTGINLSTNQSNLMLGYWDASDYLSPRGNPIYQSVSFINPEDVFSNRQLLTSKYRWHRSFSSNLNFSFLFEAYYDIPISHFDYGYGIYLSFTPDFFLANIPL